MERIKFKATDHVVCVVCSDGRSQPPIQGVPEEQVHWIRLPGGCFTQWVCGETSVERDIVRNTIAKQVQLLVGLKHAVAVVVTTHAHCGAADALNFDEARQREELLSFITTLQQLDMGVPIYAAHDNHCVHGVSRTFRLVWPQMFSYTSVAA